MNDDITNKERLHIDKVVDFAKHIDDNGFHEIGNILCNGSNRNTV